MTTHVTIKDIIAGLEKSGIEQNDRLMVHCSLSSFGWVDGGEQTLITALQRAVGIGGVVMMPTFTYGQEPFDRSCTPSRTGIISEAFRLSPDVIRSEHPGFSVAIWGRKAADLAAGHRTEAGVGRDTPLHRLIEHNGKILLMGVDQLANSTFHLAQDLAQVPYLGRFRMTEIVEPGGKRIPFQIRRAGCSLGFNKAQQTIDLKGIEYRMMIGDSIVRIMPGKTLLNLGVELLQQDPAFLLCDYKDCSSCAEAREKIKEQGE